MNNLVLLHEGRLGQRWGQRNGPPYPLGTGQMSGREVRLMRKSMGDEAFKKQTKIDREKDEAASRAERKVQREAEKHMKKYEKELDKLYVRNGNRWMFEHNKELANFMNTRIKDIKLSDDGVVKWVALRGEFGLSRAVLYGNDTSYLLGKLKNGVYSDARTAYTKDTRTTKYYK